MCLDRGTDTSSSLSSRLSPLTLSACVLVGLRPTPLHVHARNAAFAASALADWRLRILQRQTETHA